MILEDNNYIKSIFILILLMGLIPIVSADSLNMVGNTQIPVLNGNNIIDKNGFEYSDAGNGLYKVEYNIQKFLGIKTSSKPTYFGFGVSGKLNGIPFKKLSTDYTWTSQLYQQGKNYIFKNNNNDNSWKTEFDFTDTKTKITNTLTNNQAYDITNAKFYYLMSVETGDVVKYNENTYTVPTNPNVHLTGNFNDKIPYFSINDNVLFDFYDIIEHGFNVTDVYVVPASTLGFSSTYKVIAIGFTKGDGTINVGETVVIDPSLNQVGGTVTLWGNYTYDYVNLSGGAILYIVAYNGTVGTGMLNLTVNNALNVDSTSSINGDSRGFRGGGGGAADTGGSGGEGIGTQQGNNGDSDGAGSGDGGGGAGGGATTGASGGRGDQGSGGGGGAFVGTFSGFDNIMGGGAGGGGGGWGGGGNSGGSGNSGGAALKIISPVININGTITMDGGNGGDGGTGSSYKGGGGGGASAGSILLQGTNINLSFATITLTGGSGGYGYHAGYGATSGDNGVGGRFKVFYNGTFKNTSMSITGAQTQYYTSTPTITFPTNNSYQNNFSLYINWTGGTPPYNTTYQLSTDDAFSTIVLQGNTTNQGFSSGLLTPAAGQSLYARIRANYNGSGGFSDSVFFYKVPDYTNVTYPYNATTLSNTLVNLQWTENNQSTPSNFQLSTTPSFSNIIASGTESSFTNALRGTSSFYLSLGQTYYWRVTNSTGNVSSTFQFTISSSAVVNGAMNLTVYDEQDSSKQILNYTAYAYNSTSVVTKNSNTVTGWANFTGELLGNSEYLIIVVPNGTFSNYYQRMVLFTNPGSLMMYLPNGTAPNTIVYPSFTIYDITGLFPFQTSTLTIKKAGLIMEKAYFSADGTHPVYLIQGQNYNIQITNGNNVYYYQNFIPSASVSTPITINNFSVNVSQTNPFTYNITQSPTLIELTWNDIASVMNNINFTIRKGIAMVQICQQTTSLSHGQIDCPIDNTTQYHVIFSAKMNDGTFRNSSFVVDYSYGKRKTSTGTSSIDGTDIGTGFVWNYGTFVMPDWIYNWTSLILIILLAGSFGGFHSGLGGIITGIIALLLEVTGLFKPLGNVIDPDNLITMGITGGLVLLTIIYYLQHKDKGG